MNVRTSHLVVLELDHGVEEGVAGGAEPVAVLDHVRLEVHGGGEAAVAHGAGHVLVIWTRETVSAV